MQLVMIVLRKEEAGPSLQATHSDPVSLVSEASVIFCRVPMSSSINVGISDV